MIRIRGVFGAAFAAALLSMLPLTPASAYDAEAGKQTAATCVVCHGQGGNSTNPAVPSIAGQWNDYVVLALFQFRKTAIDLNFSSVDNVFCVFCLLRLPISYPFSLFNFAEPIHHE